MRNILVFPDTQSLERSAAERFVERARASIADHGVFTVALSGGSTPKRLFALLAADPYRSQLAWDKIQFFWGDERTVPPDDKDSNYRMANEALLSHVPVPPDHVHRIEAENPDPAAAAAAYAVTIRKVFGSVAGGSELPRFDLILLGMGPDGHTASLFPGTTALHEQKALVVANWVEKFNTWRITMSAPLINHAACVAFLIEGEEKAEPLREVLFGTHQPELYPSQLINPSNGECYWFVDEPAARLIPHSERTSA
jgi:6-phosphogluconolactonase